MVLKVIILKLLQSFPLNCLDNACTNRKKYFEYNFCIQILTYSEKTKAAYLYTPIVTYEPFPWKQLLAFTNIIFDLPFTRISLKKGINEQQKM